MSAVIRNKRLTPKGTFAFHQATTRPGPSRPPVVRTNSASCVCSRCAVWAVEDIDENIRLCQRVLDFLA